MSPQKNPQRDWDGISQSLCEIIDQHTPGFTQEQQKVLTKRFTDIVERYQTHINVDYIIDALTAALMPEQIDIDNKALLLNKVLETVKSFLGIKPLWHTTRAGQ